MASAQLARAASREARRAVTEKATWMVEAERGTVLGLRFVVALCDLFGRRVARAFVRILALYFTLFARRAGAASRLWLGTVLDRPIRFRDVYRHLCTFALVTLDRVFLLQGKRGLFALTSHGTEHLAAQRDAGRGAVLVGAHFGSFEALRAQGDTRDYDIHVLAYQDNARKITSVFAALSPEMQARVINLGAPGALLHAKDVVDAGGMVAVLGDRVGLNAREVEVPFFGRNAPFPTGPFLLAHSLRVPVYFVLGVYRDGNRYDLYCEPLAERVQLPRKGREEALRVLVADYASRLERHAREAPYNWFNMYDFWSPRSQ